MNHEIVEAKGKFDQYLQAKSLRRTGPRDTIVDIFLRTEKHVSTEQLYNLSRKKHKDVGYATVSRTLKLLEQAGLCRQIDFGDGTMRFEHKYKHQHHDHLVCTGCGAFEEIYSDKLEKLQQKLVEEHGYVQNSHKLNIFGLCPKCQKKKL